ncbi:MAG: hypothetical protein D6701_06425 [Gemmatimonadetes bacterium]|nr:MAG: hypothetical protein D6701_06425 [Gemmatimonadota bacterium]
MTPTATPPAKDEFRSLDPAKIHQTIEFRLARIREAFPGSGLSRVCEQLAAVSARAAAEADWLRRPIVGLRVGVGVVVLLVVAGIVSFVTTFQMPTNAIDVAELIQVIEAGLNDIVLFGIAGFFLFTLETRIKRRRALRGLHELRALAHVIDMHQLSKDPHFVGVPTEVSGGSVTTRSPEELALYLDFCTDMLSLLGKVAVLYVQDFDDPVTLASVTEIETVSAGLSRKIWQKLIVLSRGSPAV